MIIIAYAYKVIFIVVYLYTHGLNNNNQLMYLIQEFLS